MKTKFGSKNSDKIYNLLSDGKEHISHEMNSLVGWSWTKPLSLVKQYGERTGEFAIHSKPEKVGNTLVKKYWLVKKSSGIVKELKGFKELHDDKIRHSALPVFVSEKQGKLL